MKKTVYIILLIIFIIGLNSSIPALALLREHHQLPGVLRYHAQHSIKDRQQRAWQVILFPKDELTETKYYLRLVGFPDLVDFIHPQSLEIITTKGDVLTASDVFASVAPAPNVGQYDVSEIMAQFPSKGSVKLIFSLLKEDNKIEDISLKISPAIMTEWQWLYRKDRA